MPPFGHRVARVDRDVEQRGFELARIGQHDRAVRRDGDLDRDALVERAPQHVGERMQQGADVERIRLQHLAPRKGQQLARQLGAAPGGARRGADELLAVRVVGERGKLLEHLQIALDDGEQVVEVVRDAAGQLADAFEPLRVAQVLLRLRPLQAGGQKVAERLEKAHLVVAERPVLARAHRQHADGPAAIGQRHRQSADQARVEIGLRHRETRLAAVVGNVDRPRPGTGRSRATCRADSRTVSPGRSPGTEPTALATRNSRWSFSSR